MLLPDPVLQLISSPRISSADSEFYAESFLANISAQHALSKSQFRILMASIWPMYSKMQMIASVLLALTYPGDGGRLALSRGSTSVQGLIYESDRSTVMLPLTMMVLVSAANALFVIPKTVSTMWKLHVGTSMRRARAPDAVGWMGTMMLTDGC